MNIRSWAGIFAATSMWLALQQEGYLADEQEEEMDPFQLDIAAEMENIQAGFEARNQPPQQR